MGRTKKEYADELADEFHLPARRVRRLLDRFFEQLLDDLVDTGRVELRGLGSFQTVERARRRIPDPTTIGDGVPDASLDIPPYRVVRFRASKKLRERLAPKE